DVTLQAGASWTGVLTGVRNFFGQLGGTVTFEEGADIDGDLNRVGTSYVFSDEGGTIDGNVSLTTGSMTTGGTIDDRINVVGSVTVDETSTLGGNWYIGGSLDSSGILSPGNSIGRVTIGDDLNLYETSEYEVEVDLSGDADLV